MATAVPVSRAQVLAHRAAASGLHRGSGRWSNAGDVDALAPLDLGVQDTPPGSAVLALTARLGAPPPDGDAGLALAWTTRGAPHLHRPADLPALARALWPLSDADATARYGTGVIRDGASLGLAACAAAALAVHQVVREPVPKGEVSRAVSDRVPAALTHDCGPCGARHISGALFQLVGLPAGVRLQRDGRTLLLAPVEDWPVPVPPEPDPGRAAGLVSTYLRLLGPATPADAAAFVGTKVTPLRPAWPDGLVEVDVEGRRAWLPAGSLDALRSAPPPPGVRLLPPSDPLLQARDRGLTVPDRARQKALWMAIAAPGAVLVRGEVAGVWRAKAAGRRLDVTVTPFEPLQPGLAEDLDAEARLVAAARGATEVRVVVAEESR